MVSIDGQDSRLPARVRELRRALGAPVILLVPPAQTAAAVAMLSQGADDYLMRPPNAHEVRARLTRLLERHELDSRLSFLQDEMSKKSGMRKMEARSPAMRALVERMLRVAPMRSTVLIFGESGVGKELVARSIHFNSPRRDRPLIALNCAAIPASLIESELFGHERGSFTGAHARSRGKFEIAHGGTLFLDEIGEMVPETQAKLLRVLEEREFMRVGGDRSVRVDVRVIAATNADLEALVRDGGFRQDLYYRLKVVTLRVPPLRERRLDAPFLVRGFLTDLARANAVEPKTITDEALTALTHYHWPGNVRELKNLIESLLVSVRASEIDAAALPHYVTQGAVAPVSGDLDPGMTLAEMECELIRRTLEFTGGNRTHSAELLGIGVRTLQRKIGSYGLAIPPTRRRPRTPVGQT
jgi:DNA-binding NtrC family response regulator